jgi:hypothetical protein
MCRYRRATQDLLRVCAGMAGLGAYTNTRNSKWASGGCTSTILMGVATESRMQRAQSGQAGDERWVNVCNGFHSDAPDGAAGANDVMLPPCNLPHPVLHEPAPLGVTAGHCTVTLQSRHVANNVACAGNELAEGGARGGCDRSPIYASVGNEGRVRVDVRRARFAESCMHAHLQGP